MDVSFWVQTLIHILIQSLRYIQYHITLDRVITAPEYIYTKHWAADAGWLPKISANNMSGDSVGNMSNQIRVSPVAVNDFTKISDNWFHRTQGILPDTTPSIWNN